MLAALTKAILAPSSARVEALHERFTDPDPVTEKSKLQHALRSWRAEFDELSAVGTAPSKQATQRFFEASDLHDRCVEKNPWRW
eukprot:1505209-Pyramimonas_sp.AAC.1